MRRITMIAGLITMLAAPVLASPLDIGTIQACLTRFGYHTGGIDGIAGPRTVNAVQHYMTVRFGDGWLEVPPLTRYTFFWTECAAYLTRTMPTNTR